VSLKVVLLLEKVHMPQKGGKTRNQKEMQQT